MYQFVNDRYSSEEYQLPLVSSLIRWLAFSNRMGRGYTCSRPHTIEHNGIVIGTIPTGSWPSMSKLLQSIYYYSLGGKFHAVD